MLTPSGLDTPFSCDELRSNAPEPNASGGFFVPGGTAECSAEGQWCPADWLDGYCLEGIPFARCVDNAWIASCEEVGDAGLPDADSDA